MAGLSRRGFLGGAAATAAAATLGTPHVHAQKKGGTIRFIPHADLKVLDPIATTAYVTRNHAYFIYDTLFGTDEHLAIKPSSNVPFIMPARIAATSENEPIKETIGSGPFKFVKDEWQPGNQVVYVKNPDYVPRQEKPSGSTGGKVVHLDRVVWRYMPDH